MKLITKISDCLEKKCLCPYLQASYKEMIQFLASLIWTLFHMDSMLMRLYCLNAQNLWNVKHKLFAVD